MSALSFLDITPDSCASAQRVTEAYLKGERPVESIMEQHDSTSAFLTAVETEAETRDKLAATDSPGNNYRNRVLALLAFAAERDLRYALSSRRHMMAVGFNQKLRTRFNTAMSTTIDL